MPMAIGDLLMWTDSIEISGVSDTDPLPQWDDLSGNDNHAKEAANPPTYRTGIVNGYPVVRFDGVNDRLITDGNVLSGNDADFTIYFVAANYAFGVVERFISIGWDVAGGARELASLNADSAVLHSLRFEGAARTYASGDEDPLYCGFSRDAPFTESYQVFENGNRDLAKAAPATGNTLGNTRVALAHTRAGAVNSFMATDLLATMVYGKELTDEEFGLLDAYVVDRFEL